jgi:hypothetical protein
MVSRASGQDFEKPRCIMSLGSMFTMVTKLGYFWRHFGGKMPFWQTFLSKKLCLIKTSYSLEQRYQNDWNIVFLYLFFESNKNSKYFFPLFPQLEYFKLWMHWIELIKVLFTSSKSKIVRQIYILKKSCALYHRYNRLRMHVCSI